MVLWEKTEISCLHKKWHNLEERLDCAAFLCRFVNFFRSKAPPIPFLANFTQRHGGHNGTEGRMRYCRIKFIRIITFRLQISLLISLSSPLISLSSPCRRERCARGEPSTFGLGWKFTVRTSSEAKPRVKSPATPSPNSASSCSGTFGIPVFALSVIAPTRPVR
jgi:predicted nucleic acid binding AN1-type Zn finger protein